MKDNPIKKIDKCIDKIIDECDKLGIYLPIAEAEMLREHIHDEYEDGPLGD